ncbi:MAG: class I SAM-dependent methyltransferase [Clostridiales bacterium]|nr:class I SAM-dependent methyltransferase [Clostridiales bacterium]
MPVHLDQRLLTVAGLVREGAYLADIGTDHGYLPVYLVQTGRISRAVAADINEKPLQQAASAVAAYGLEQQITTVLSDGLKQVDDRVEDIVIAGMGGELIGSIISGAKWLKNAEKRLILQPMTQDVYLREYLAEQGFVIEDERIAEDHRHLYVVFSVSFAGTRQILSPEEQYVGKSIYKTDPLSRKYLQKKLNRLEKISAGLEKSGKQSEAAEHRQLAEQLKTYL